MEEMNWQIMLLVSPSLPCILGVDHIIEANLVKMKNAIIVAKRVTSNMIVANGRRKERKR